MRLTQFAIRGLFGLVACAAALSACETELDGLITTPLDSKGPKITFDLLARPLPEIPFPNDMATRIDVDSPTGRRVNASLSAPTILENEVRNEFNLLDGWGTFAPMTVSFEGPVEPLAIRDAHRDDDFSNDAVYLINLKTGVPVSLDLGRGNFPIVLQNNDKYFMNDPRGKSSNVLFETYAEDLNGNGQLDPGEDTDSDGVLDVPNTADPTKPRHGENPDDRALAGQEGNDIYRDLLSFYERESNTLLIRPVVVLEQRTTYAVVLTNRIKGADGETIRSPFPFVNHAAQTEQLRPLLGFLGKDKLAGLTDKDVAFAWAFTTQSVTTDLEAIREGLYERGNLKWIGKQVTDRLEPMLYFAKDSTEVETHPVHPLRDKKAGLENVYTVPMEDFAESLKRLGNELGIDEGPDLDNLIDSYKFVDYFVMGSFKTANFLDDPSKPTFDAVFRVNPEAGLARVWSRPEKWIDAESEALIESITHPIARETSVLRQKAKLATRDRVVFMLAVPKALNGHKAPFPVSIYGHGYTSARVEHLGFAGNLAKFGIASVCIDSYGHGLDVSQTERKAIEAVIGQFGFGPLTDVLFKGRARDLDNDLTDNSGGDFWVADTFHTRDVVRQSIVDWMQLVRVFRAFGTYEMGDVNSDGKADLAGDFNGDGIVDVGGQEYPAPGQGMQPDFVAGKRNEGSDFFAWGQSLGGILAGILPAIEPAVAAAAPVAGGAGLADIGIRSEQGGVIQAVFLEILGPIIGGEKQGNGKVRLIYDVQDVNSEARFPITNEESDLELQAGDKITVHNLDMDNTEDKDDFAIVGADLRFRLHVAGDNASYLDGAPIFETHVPTGRCEFKGMSPADAKAEMARQQMVHPADCLELKVFRNGEMIKEIKTFGTNVRRGENEPGFQMRTYDSGTPLIALARGFGMKRGHKTFRRFMSLAQSIMEPGDPANYAAHYFGDRLLESRKGNPSAVLVVGTTGDLNVPVNTAYAQARIAGVLPYVYDSAKHAAWGMSPNDVLIESKAMECLEKLRYFTPVADHMDRPNDAVPVKDQKVVDLVKCLDVQHCRETALVDPTGYAWDPVSEKYLDSHNSKVPMLYGGVPRLKTSLRDAVEVEYPGLDKNGDPSTRKSALIMPYLESHGKHGFDVPHPEDPFDIDLFMINMIGRFFETRGKEIRYETCMHRDGYDRARMKDKVADPEAVRVAGCEFIPTFPATF